MRALFRAFYNAGWPGVPCHTVASAGRECPVAPWRRISAGVPCPSPAGCRRVRWVQLQRLLGKAEKFERYERLVLFNDADMNESLSPEEVYGSVTCDYGEIRRGGKEQVVHIVHFSPLCRRSVASLCWGLLQPRVGGGCSLFYQGGLLRFRFAGCLRPSLRRSPGIAAHLPRRHQETSR